MLLTELLPADHIRVPLAAGTKEGVLRELALLLVGVAGGDEAEVLAAVRDREAVMSTGIGFGVAIPHGKSGSVPKLSVVAGVSAIPLPFDSVDGAPVRLLFCMVGPQQAAGQHVQVLGRIARLVRGEVVRDQLLRAPTPAAFHDILTKAEAR